VRSATPLGRLVNGLPDSLKQQHAGQTRWQWIGLLVCALAALLAGTIVFRALAALAKRLRSPWDSWTRAPAPALAAVIVKLATDFADNGLNITGAVLSMVRTVGEVALLLLIAWTVWRILAAVAELLIASPRISNQGMPA
jgi:chromate transport protein ChrA